MTLVSPPPDQKQRRHREAEPGWLGASDAHTFDVALGQVVCAQNRARPRCRARLKNRDDRDNRRPKKTPANVLPMMSSSASQFRHWAALAPESMAW
jgi:hypothetical protein